MSDDHAECRTCGHQWRPRRHASIRCPKCAEASAITVAAREAPPPPLISPTRRRGRQPLPGWITAVIWCGCIGLGAAGFLGLMFLMMHTRLPSDSVANPKGEGRKADGVTDPEKAPEKQDDSVAWGDAKAPQRVGDIEVHIEHVEHGSHTFTRFGKEETSTPVLGVTVSIKNHSKTRLVEYRPWTPERSFRKPPQLASVKDTFGNVYKPVSPGVGEKFEGQKGPSRIDPEEWHRDLLVFGPPVKNVEALLLALPLAAFGEKGTIRFRIPASMIKQIE